MLKDKYMGININYSLQYILLLLSTYVITLSINKVISIDISVITYLLALLIIVFNIIFIYSRYIYINKKIFFLYMGSLIFVLFNVFLNKMGFTEILKIIGSQLFLIVGMLSLNKIEIRKNKKIIYIGVLVFIPILVLLLEMLNLIAHKNELSSIFINKNNAILYFLSLTPLLYYFEFKKRTLIIYIFIMTILFKTMGALLAFILAVIFIYKKLNFKTLIYFMLVSITIPFIFIWLKDANFSAIDRIINVVDIIQTLFSKYSLKELANLQYGKAVELTGSSDLSFLFRIKHWSDIIQYYLNANWYEQLLGIGIGNIPNVTKMELVAHNDFLKLIVEFGPLYFVLYIIIMFKILKSIIKTYPFVSIPLLTIFIYFGTENLMNNFLAMSFFYYFLGIYYTKSRRKIENIND